MKRARLRSDSLTSKICESHRRKNTALRIEKVNLPYFFANFGSVAVKMLP